MEVGEFGVFPESAKTKKVQDGVGAERTFIEEWLGIVTPSRHRHRVVWALKQVLRLRNLETAEHIQRMEGMVEVIGNRLRLSSQERERLRLLASMHDIGKVAVPDHILNKPGPLTHREWRVMRDHTEAGRRLALSISEISGIAWEIACHHERWDGTGYPYRLRGEEIPLLSRIISVMDAYDAITHDRVYRAASTHREAMTELVRCAGSQFDPIVVRLFRESFERWPRIEEAVKTSPVH